MRIKLPTYLHTYLPSSSTHKLSLYVQMQKTLKFKIWQLT